MQIQFDSPRGVTDLPDLEEKKEDDVLRSAEDDSLSVVRQEEWCQVGFLDDSSQSCCYQ